MEYGFANGVPLEDNQNKKVSGTKGDLHFLENGVRVNVFTFEALRKRYLCILSQSPGKCIQLSPD